MEIRTTNLGTTNSMLNYITTAESKYYALSEEASSGKKLTKPSDDPTGTKTVLNINAKLDQLSSYSDNMKLAQNELDVVDDTYASVTNALQNAKDLATQAANGTYSQSDLNGIKVQINQIIEGVVDLANTQYNGNYLFSGTATSTPAYSVTRDTNGNITDIKYNGTASTGEYERYVQISDGVSVAVNTTGDQVFGASTTGPPAVHTGLMNTLMTLSNALGPVSDSSAISGTLDSFSTDLDTISAARTQEASVTKRFDITGYSIDTATTQLTASKSDLQDADLSTVLSDLATQKLALQATMSVTSELLSGKTLLDYL